MTQFQHILVTGAEGFIGSHLVEALIAQGRRVRAMALYNSFGRYGWLDTLPPTTRAKFDLVMGDVRDAFSVREAMRGLVDTGSLLELRAGFGQGILTALARIEGRPVGLLANNPRHLGGAIDAEAADKAARFMQLCDAHGLPIVSLCDTPGFMVGPEIEQQAQVRTQLSIALQGIVTQQLLPTSDGRGRVVACEVLIPTPAIRNLIREGKTHQIYAALQTSGATGMQTMDADLVRLVRAGKIGRALAEQRASVPEELNRLLGGAPVAVNGAHA